MLGGATHAFMFSCTIILIWHMNISVLSQPANHIFMKTILIIVCNEFDQKYTSLIHNCLVKAVKIAKFYSHDPLYWNKFLDNWSRTNQQYYVLFHIFFGSHYFCPLKSTYGWAFPIFNLLNAQLYFVYSEFYSNNFNFSIVYYEQLEKSFYSVQKSTSCWCLFIEVSSPLLLSYYHYTNMFGKSSFEDITHQDFNHTELTSSLSSSLAFEPATKR